MTQINRKLPVGTEVVVNKNVPLYGGLTATVIGMPSHIGQDRIMRRVRFTPPAPGQPETDWLPRTDLTEKGPAMVHYKSNVEVPESIKSFFERFLEQGEITFDITDGRMTFEFDAEDLYEAAEIIHNVTREVDASLPVHGEHVEIKKPRVSTAARGIEAKDVDIPVGVSISAEQTDPRRNYWPAAASAAILKAHGVKVAE